MVISWVAKVGSAKKKECPKENKADKNHSKIDVGMGGG